MRDILERVQVFDDSVYVASDLRNQYTESYICSEAATHIDGLWDLVKGLEKEVIVLRSIKRLKDRLSPF